MDLPSWVSRGKFSFGGFFVFASFVCSFLVNLGFSSCEILDLRTSSLIAIGNAVITLYFSILCPVNWQCLMPLGCCRGNYTRHLDKVLEEAAAEFYPHIRFMRVSHLSDALSHPLS